MYSALLGMTGDRGKVIDLFSNVTDKIDDIRIKDTLLGTVA